MGVPDPEWGQRLVAVIVWDPAAGTGNPEEIRQWVKGRLRSSKTPESIVFRSELPKTETGKLLRRVLQAELKRYPPRNFPAGAPVPWRPSAEGRQGTAGFAVHAVSPEAEQGLLGVGGDQGAVGGEDVAPAEGAAVREDRALLAQQQPCVGGERPVEPDCVRGDRARERLARVALADPVDRAQRGADQRQVGGVGGERGR